MKKLLLTLPFLAVMACTSDDIQESNLNMLAAGKWNLSGVITEFPIESGDTLINIFDLETSPECLKDDQIEISSNGDYEILIGEDQCDNTAQFFKFPHKGAWRFSSDESHIILNPGELDSTIMTIDTLYEAELRLTYIDTIPQMILKNDSALYPITILYTR